MGLNIRRLIALASLGLLIPACGISGGGTLSPTVAPGIPSNVVMRPGNRSATIEWTPSAQGAEYVVLRSLAPQGPFFPVSVPSGFQTPTSYVDPELLNGTAYYYVVVARNPFGQSAESAVASGTPGFKAVAVSGGHGGAGHLALLRDGSVWTWGLTSSNLTADVPVRVPDLFNVTAVSCGWVHSLVLENDGRVWAWGDNTFGELGSPSFPNIPTIVIPAPVAGVQDAISVACGEGFSMALTQDGKVWVWGVNGSGQFGLGTSTPSSATPQEVPGISDIIAISGGQYHCLALRKDGLVFAWGSNTFGAVGTPLGPSIFPPTEVDSVTGIVAISAGSNHSLALRNDGTVWAWGDNRHGQLGIGTASSTTVAVPTQTLNLSGIVAIAGGGMHSVASTGSGTVWAWGDNTVGELGDGTSGASAVSTPVQVQNLKTAASVTASSETSCALGTDGTVWTWGYNYNGGLGNGTGKSAVLPVELPNITGVTAIAAGGSSSTVLRAPGTVWGVGARDQGQLGEGTISATPSSVTVQASVVTTAKAIASGDSHVLALLPSGAVYGWGWNHKGQVGDGSSLTAIATPVLVSTPSGITAIVCGPLHSLAIRSDQTLWSWGSNQTGQLGNGLTGTTPNPTPTQIPGLTGVVSVAAGHFHTIAARSDGTVWVWGANTDSQLGPAASGISPVPTPTQVPGITGAVAVASGGMHCLVLLNDGTLLSWGRGSSGQLGRGGGSDSAQAVPVTGMKDVISVVGGLYHSMALKSDGTVWTWGNNTYGQLGSPIDSLSTLPLQVEGISGVTAISTETNHSMALLANQTVRQWGMNLENQIGVPFVLLSPTPVSITH